MRASFASLWLMTRKRPGKICRAPAVSPIVVKPPQYTAPKNSKQYQGTAQAKQRGTALA
jgi:hypothetical protein